ncbi:NTP/NDP exchange transporter [Elongatibacter sediminis]|uniref:MFS transporter n=1 Tax=Elongatibacter sediminis TaxID=3119006 RepID=A0AAW9RBH8_9GAMM
MAFAYFFFLLGGYFMLRPIRGTVAAYNTDVLHWLYTATFLTMLAIVPLFGFLVSRFRRGRFVPAIYLFFMLNLAGFLVAFEGSETPLWIQRVFYVWLSVFNLFVVSVFWSFMADVFRPDQAQRLFGFIMAGGSLGAVLGPLVTAGLVAGSGAAGIMAIALACLGLATLMAILLGRYQRRTTHHPAAVIGGGVWEGALRVFRSKYLLFACLLMLVHNLTSTFLYNGLAVLVDTHIVGFNERTVFFGWVDLVVQVIAFVFQFFITSRLITALGMPRTLVIMPALLAAGFVFLGSALGLVLLAALQVAQRSMNYGILGPAKEMLFTVVDRETRYKCKNFIDTAIYRGSDVTASWIFRGLTGAGLTIGQVAWVYVPVMGLWAWGAWRLGTLYNGLLEDRLTGREEAAPP